ncbi:MAG: lanthionine synthetase C family protein [Candidatus Eremiobacterota bacterium]
MLWRALLSGSAADRALAAACEAAARLAHPDRVEAGMDRARQQSEEPAFLRWTPWSVAQGDAGLALLYGQLDRTLPGQGWDALAHRCLERAVRATEQPGARLSGALFSGWAGLLFVAEYLSRGTRYARLRTTLRAQAEDSSQRLLERLQAHRGGLGVGDWDLISGLTGCAVALTREPVLRFLADLLQRTGWVTPADQVHASMRPELPEGGFNLGLAHGVPGPLALLCLAGQPAPEPALGILERARLEDDWGPNWPNAVPLRAGGQPDYVHLRPTHAAWCYGSPGVARALWHAGRRQPALEAMRAVARRPDAARRLASPALCHGWAGLALQALRFWNDTSDPDLEALARTMFQRLTEETSWMEGHPGFLDGAAGIALALAAAASHVEPGWDRILLLS